MLAILSQIILEFYGFLILHVKIFLPSQRQLSPLLLQ